MLLNRGIMIDVIKHGIILEKTENLFENFGIRNSGAYQEGETVHLFYQAMGEDSTSCIGYCKLEGPLKVVERWTRPIFCPDKDTEIVSFEDPRIVKILDTYYLSYSAFDGVNVFGSYATSNDLKIWKPKGVLTPKFTIEEYGTFMEHLFDKISEQHFQFYYLFMRQKLKDSLIEKKYVTDRSAVFFPKKIKERFIFLHELHPSIQLVCFNDLSKLTPEFWEEYIFNLEKHILMEPKYQHENFHVGAGAPPVETELGWLLIYHSTEITPKGFVYHVCAALLDLKDPSKLIARLKKPLFSPTEPYETKGYVDNVIFPTGTAQFKDDLYIYYGTSAAKLAVASVNLKSLLEALKKNAKKKKTQYPSIG